jgi:ribulose-bisphosphate carboxylase small chain
VRLTQGQFSFLPELSDAEIKLQIQYAIAQGFALSVEFTDDPHPRNAYWNMWGHPMFDIKDAAGVMLEVDGCRKAHDNKYIRVLAFDSRKGFETVRMSFIVNRPAEEPGFDLVRSEGPGRQVHYTMRSYAVAKPAGERY